MRPTFADNGGTWGVSRIDYDNDGDMDFCAANYGIPNTLYRNDGTFTRITNSPVTTGSNRSLSASWGDYDNDGDLDLFISNAGGRNRLFENDSCSGCVRGGVGRQGCWNF